MLLSGALFAKQRPGAILFLSFKVHMLTQNDVLSDTLYMIFCGSMFAQ